MLEDPWPNSIMLSRSSLSVRRLVSQRPGASNHDETLCIEEDDEVAQLEQPNSRRHRRAIRATKARKKSKGLDLIIQRSHSIHEISGQIPPLPSSPRRSSLSSLSGAEGRTVLPSRKKKEPRNCTLCLSRGGVKDTAPKTSPKRLSERKHLIIDPPRQSWAPAAAREQAHIPTESPGQAPCDVSPCTLDHPDPDPVHDDKAEEIEDLTETIQRLARETDHAFEAVGAALADAHAALAPPIKAISKIVETDAEDPLSPTRPPPPLPLRDSGETPPLQMLCKNVTPPLKSPERTASLSKTNRPRSKKARRASGPLGRTSRWTFGENVAGLLSRQVFRKIEADETLTPDRLQAVRATREYQLRLKRSNETLHKADADRSNTPVEPFHLQDLPSRIGAAGVATSTVAVALPSNDPAPPPSSCDLPVRRDFSIPRKALPPTAAASALSLRSHAQSMGECGSLDSRAVSVPIPPMKNPARRIAKVTRVSLPMPTIPEVLATTPVEGNKRSLPSPSPRPSSSSLAGASSHANTKEQRFAPEQDQDFVFFHATPYTLNAPAFRHSRIQFPKSEMARYMNLSRDEPLDWTAFQMAILGGAGEFLSGPSADFTASHQTAGARNDVDDGESLAAWFEGFGFASAGQLVSEGTQIEGSPSTVAVRRSGEYSPASWSMCGTDSEGDDDEKKADVHATEDDLPIPVAHEHPSGFWNEGVVDTARFLRDNETCKIKRWTVDGTPRKRYNAGHGATTSLPQSPVVECVYVGSGSEHLLSMGSNLERDLHEFLSWEAQNVCSWSPK